MTALETLQQARLEVAKKLAYTDWNQLKTRYINEKWDLDEHETRAVLLAMERIAEMSWEAGIKRMGWKEGITWDADKETNEVPDKSTYMNNLFPKTI